jgi:hypothetical protein
MRSFWIRLERILSFLIVSCSCIIMGCSSSISVSVTTPTPQPTQIVSSRWEPISLPLPGTRLLAYTVSPTDPETLYACTNAVGTSTDSFSEGPITLWGTRDAGHHWFTISLPATPATGCSISIAFSQPRRIAFDVTSAFDDQRPCDRDILYLSTDSGASWRRIPHHSVAPQGAAYGFCSITMAGQHLFLWYTFGGGENVPQLNLLELTDNDGITWSRADSDFGPGAFFLPPQIGENGTLATIVLHARPTSEARSVLWMSHDSGRSWQQRAALPASIGTYLLTSPQQNPSWPTPAVPFYALAHEQIPSNLYGLQVFQSPDGQQWFAIPPLPVSGASEEHPGLLQALEATNDGHLLAFGVNPKAGLPASVVAEQKQIAAFWLWLWDSHSSHWQVLSSPLTHPADENCGLCWGSALSSGLKHTTYLYVYRWGDSNNLFRMRLPVV